MHPRKSSPGWLVALLVAFGLCLVHPPARADLVSHWPLDGELDDVGPAGNDGLFVGDEFALFVEGFDGEEEGAVLFDGVDDYILVEQNEGLPLYQHPQFSLSLIHI